MTDQTSRHADFADWLTAKVRVAMFAVILTMTTSARLLHISYTATQTETDTYTYRETDSKDTQPHRQRQTCTHTERQTAKIRSLSGTKIWEWLVQWRRQLLNHLWSWWHTCDLGDCLPSASTDTNCMLSTRLLDGNINVIFILHADPDCMTSILLPHGHTNVILILSADPDCMQSICLLDGHICRPFVYLMETSMLYWYCLLIPTVCRPFSYLMDTQMSSQAAQ